LATLNESIHVLNIEFYTNKPSIMVESNWYFLILFFLIIVLLYGIKKFVFNKYIANIKPVELTLGFGNSSIKYNIERNYQNLEIAHRIYIELITRKAAMPIDNENDVIKEIYDSWYSLFQITRNEIKNISGESLQNYGATEELIKMATDILNKGLRPHLTQHQAKFRKWYDEELEYPNSKGKSPQEIQRNYPEYCELIESMVGVNKLLIEYAKQLNNFIVGKNNIKN
jgi:hypothetical protein